MKFKRINDDKLQIIISKDDLSARDLKKWDFVPYNPVAQKLFQDILEEAYNECGFEVGRDTQLMIEAYPMTGESMVIVVTKISGASKGLMEQLGMEILEEHLFGEMADDEDFELEMEELVCRFEDLEHVIAVAKFIKDNYKGESGLFKYRERYYLALYDMTSLDESDLGILTEYGDLDNLSPAFLEEHAQVIIGTETIEILAGL